jgi:hypothetical protein
MKQSHDDNSDDLSNSFTSNNDNDSPDIDDEDSINEVCGGRMGTKCRLKWFLPFVVQFPHIGRDRVYGYRRRIIMIVIVYGRYMVMLKLSNII